MSVCPSVCHTGLDWIISDLNTPSQGSGPAQSQQEKKTLRRSNVIVLVIIITHAHQVLGSLIQLILYELNISGILEMARDDSVWSHSHF